MVVYGFGKKAPHPSLNAFDGITIQNPDENTVFGGDNRIGLLDIFKYNRDDFEKNVTRPIIAMNKQKADIRIREMVPQSVIQENWGSVEKKREKIYAWLRDNRTMSNWLMLGAFLLVPIVYAVMYAILMSKRLAGEELRGTAPTTSTPGASGATPADSGKDAAGSISQRGAVRIGWILSAVAATTTLSAMVYIIFFPMAPFIAGASLLLTSSIAVLLIAVILEIYEKCGGKRTGVIVRAVIAPIILSAMGYFVFFVMAPFITAEPVLLTSFIAASLITTVVGLVKMGRWYRSPPWEGLTQPSPGEPLPKFSPESERDVALLQHLPYKLTLIFIVSFITPCSLNKIVKDQRINEQCFILLYI